MKKMNNVQKMIEILFLSMHCIKKILDLGLSAIRLIFRIIDVTYNYLQSKCPTIFNPESIAIYKFRQNIISPIRFIKKKFLSITKKNKDLINTMDDALIYHSSINRISHI